MKHLHLDKIEDVYSEDDVDLKHWRSVSSGSASSGVTVISSSVSLGSAGLVPSFRRTRKLLSNFAVILGLAVFIVVSSLYCITSLHDLEIEREDDGTPRPQPLPERTTASSASVQFPPSQQNPLKQRTPLSSQAGNILDRIDRSPPTSQDSKTAPQLIKKLQALLRDPLITSSQSTMVKELMVLVEKDASTNTEVERADSGGVVGSGLIYTSDSDSPPPLVSSSSSASSTSASNSAGGTFSIKGDNYRMSTNLAIPKNQKQYTHSTSSSNSAGVLLSTSNSVRISSLADEMTITLIPNHQSSSSSSSQQVQHHQQQQQQPYLSSASLLSQVNNEMAADLLDSMQDLFDGRSMQLPWCPFVQEHYWRYSDIRQSSDTYFIALNLYNSDKVIPNLGSQILFLAEFLGGADRLFISIYENGSTDDTQEALEVLKHHLDVNGIGNSIKMDNGGPVDWKTVYRIEKLAELRNLAMEPLYNQNVTSKRFEQVVFINDVFFCASDILELIHQQVEQHSHITCGLDFVYLKSIKDHIFYDNWVTRDISGNRFWSITTMWRYQMLSKHEDSRKRWEAGKPFQVWSCWNGVAVLDARPFYQGVRFRRSDIAKNECSSSECSLVAKDFWSRGFGRAMIVPSVKIVYWSESHEQVHRDIAPTALALTESQKNFLRKDDDHGQMIFYDDETWVQPVWLLGKNESMIDWKMGPSTVLCLPLDGPGNHFADERQPEWESVVAYREASLI